MNKEIQFMLNQKNSLFLLKLCVVFIFLGRAYQYLFFNAPFRAILWDESLLKPFIESIFKISWREYATNLTVDKWIQISIKINGVIFLLGALASIYIRTTFNRKFLRILISFGGFLLLLLAYLTLKERFFQHGQFFEHAIQIGLPFTLLYAIDPRSSIDRITLILKILVSLTFVSHGLYAVGIYPVPGHFIDMVIGSLGVSENTAVVILKIAGILDFLISILLFVPKVSKYALLYAFIWGTITAIARFTSNFDANFIGSSFHQTIYLVIYRLPHGLIPLLVFLIQQKKYSKNTHKLITQKSIS